LVIAAFSGLAAGQTLRFFCHPDTRRALVHPYLRCSGCTVD